MHSSYAYATSSTPNGVPFADLTSTPPSSIPRPGSSSSPSPQYHKPRLVSTRNPSARNYNSPSSNYRSASTTNPQHISSAIAAAYSGQVGGAAERPPRTSSLLPPPKIVPNLAGRQTPTAFQGSFNASSATISSAPEAVNHSDAPKPDRRVVRHTHSRSSSLGGLTESLRNLNRWSASTTSSQPSPQRNGTLARRLSIDIIGQPNAPALYRSPSKKLQKSRPSTAGGSPREVVPARYRRGSPVPPPASLPPIASLPSLEQDIWNGAESLAGTPPTLNGRPSLDEGGYFWNGSPTQRGTPASIPPPRRADPVLPAAEMPHTQNEEARGHSRNRSQAAKGSQDTSSSSRSRDRQRQPSQKATLNRALQKANTAVQLDNAHNSEGARQAYWEACELLQQVLIRTPGEEDKKKLEAIRKTYSSRVEELDLQIPKRSLDGKALPARPTSIENATSDNSSTNEDGEEVVVEMATVTRIARDKDADRPNQAIPSYSIPTSAAKRQLAAKAPQNLRVDRVDTPSRGQSPYLSEQYTLQSTFSRSPRRTGPELLRPAENPYMPPPLSPRRPPSPGKLAGRGSPERPTRADFSMAASRMTPEIANTGHIRDDSQESTSWLDPIDESGGSTASSVHSRTSSMGIRRKHIRGASGDTEAEFDAALDDAIEAAYDDGYEPDTIPASTQHPEETWHDHAERARQDDAEQARQDDDEDPEDTIARTLRKVEMARQLVRESEREAMELANERERRLRALLQQEEDEPKEGFLDGNDSEEEERMLEEMTKGYAIEDFALRSQSKPVPRESDSSGLTSRTWHSSMGSNPPTASTILSTVSESTVTPSAAKGPTPPLPPPSGALPQLPQPPQTSVQNATNTNASSVRNRRLSGQNPKQLKIETTKLGQPQQPVTAVLANSGANSAHPQPQARTAGYIVQQRQALSAGANKLTGPFSSRPVAPSPAPPTPTLPQVVFPDGESRSGSPSTSRPGLKKNFSSSSLKSMKGRNLSVSNVDETSDLSPGTPISVQFGASARLPALPALPTPIATAYKERINNVSTGGLYLFEMDFHSPLTPGSPDPMASDPPVPLEPCPTDTMLRPFWLMRCLYQTLAHPRGGYLSTKLFVPRDAWRVKGVKLRNLDDKVAQCDLLTAALQKLARVDTCDADAVLEEMQALEGVLEQVQAALSRKLGSSEVGVQGSGALFKDANAGDPEAGGGGANGAGGNVPRSASVTGKGGGAFSWRRLRSKNSSAGLGGSYAANKSTPDVAGGAAGGNTGIKDVPLPTLPMTPNPTSKPSKRDVTAVTFSGPYANYMAALARLFDAAQSIDQIARQVDDPGLRHADKTQVGLELCTRHAAEFFAFYICRFVLSDLSMLLDKFVKRGSEWVIS